MKLSNKFLVIALIISFVSSLSGPSLALAATTPSLGVASTFSVLSSTFTRNVGVTSLVGDLGYTTLSGSGSHTVTGSTFIGGGVGNATYVQAGADQGTALTALAVQPCTFTFANGAIDLSTDTTHGPIGVYTPGVYCTGAASAASIGTGGITLNGAGTYIFRINGAFTSVANSNVVLANGASSCDVFWTATSATTLGANTTFAGTIIDDAGITVGSTTLWNGRALAFGGTVTTDTDTITVPTCLAPSTINVTKVVINDSGRNNVVSDFPLFVNGVLVFSGDTNGFPAGSYTVTETSNSNYVTAFSGDCNVNGTITLTPGANLSCVVTNNDIPVANLPSGGGGGGGGSTRVSPSTNNPTPTAPVTLHIIKQVVNDNGGTAVASDFTLHVKDSDEDEILGSPAAGVSAPGIFYSLSPDTYTVSEDASPLYTQSFSGDCNSEGEMTLGSGDDETCTVINDDIAGVVPGLPNTGLSYTILRYIFIPAAIIVALLLLYIVRKKRIV